MHALALCLLLAAADPLAPFVGEFDATFEDMDHQSKQWTSKPMTLRGQRLVGGKYVELRGTFRFHGFEKPVELVFLWSVDPFQKRVRVAVLDDFVGLLDVFEQVSTDPLRVSNVPHGTYFPDRKGRRGFARLTVHFREGGAIRIESESSTDEGKTWTPASRVTLQPKIHVTR